MVTNKKKYYKKNQSNNSTPICNNLNYSKRENNDLYIEKFGYKNYLYHA